MLWYLVHRVVCGAAGWTRHTHCFHVRKYKDAGGQRVCAFISCFTGKYQCDMSLPKEYVSGLPESILESLVTTSGLYVSTCEHKFQNLITVLQVKANVDLLGSLDQS